MKAVADIDIDLKNRDDLLEILDHTPASVIRQNELTRHPVGVYLQRVPINPINGVCSIEYEEAEARGYIKFDFLNVYIYEGVRNESHLLQLMNKEPIWDMPLDTEISSTLFQLTGDYTASILQKMRPKSVEQLAMVIALIRPGKSHLIGRRWEEIEKEIWRPTKEGYYFKKSHGISYALAIVVQMNLLIEEAINDSEL